MDAVEPLGQAQWYTGSEKTMTEHQGCVLREKYKVTDERLRQMVASTERILGLDHENAVEFLMEARAAG